MLDNRYFLFYINYKNWNGHTIFKSMGKYTSRYH